MTKSLEQIQIENRKFILEAIHGCSYEEALKKELEIIGCQVIRKMNSGKSINKLSLTYISKGSSQLGENELYFSSSTQGNLPDKFDITEILDKDYFEILGKPLTLSRVLLALKDKKVGFYDNCLGEVSESTGRYKEAYTDYICDWNLALGEIEITLEEQTEETQRGINKLFNN